MEVWRRRRWVEGWKDESGRKTIWESKYLPIHLSERDQASHLCCSECALCVCVFSEMIMCGTLGLLWCRRRRVKGERNTASRRGRKR